MGAVEEMMGVVRVSVTEGHSGDGCEYFDEGDLFVLSCARVRRVRRGSIELIMCGGGVRSIFYCLLWIDA